MNIKKPLLTTLLIAAVFIVQAQTKPNEYNPFESIGKKGKIVTAYGDRFIEVFDYDSVQRVGSVMLHIYKKKIVQLLNADSLSTQVSDNSSASRWYSIDPKAEMQTAWSPYHFTYDNPIRYNDPDGQLPGDFYNEQGQYIGTDGKDDHKVYVVKTTQTTTQMYGKANYPQKGSTNPISTAAAAATEAQIKAGDFSGDVMKNVVQIQPEKNMKKMIEIVSKDDGTGGTKSANNREYGGDIVKGKIVEGPAGNAADPSKGKNVSTLDKDFHSHPSGTKAVPGGTAMWWQPPSKQDIITASKTEYVFGMQDGTIYIFNKTGVLATIPTKTF